jgi:hypothetical protein
MNVEIEIYMSGIIKFFKDNPNELLNLVPEDKKVEVVEKKVEHIDLSKVTGKKPGEKGRKVKFEKGSEEARLWSKEMAIRRKVLKEMKPVVNTE